VKICVISLMISVNFPGLRH